MTSPEDPSLLRAQWSLYLAALVVFCVVLIWVAYR